MKALQTGLVNLILCQLGITRAVIQLGTIATHAVMSLLAAVEAVGTSQTKEPAHLAAGKVPPPPAAGDLTLRLVLRHPLGILPALPSMVATPVATSTHHPSGRRHAAASATSILGTIPRHVTWHPAIETDGLVRAAPGIVRALRGAIGDGDIAAEIARRDLGGVGTGVGPMANLAAVEALGANVLVPVPIRRPGSPTAARPTTSSCAGISSQ